MLKKEKSAKPKIKVEEIVETEPEKVASTDSITSGEIAIADEPELKPVSEPNQQATEPPKVTSFSQLDIKKDDLPTSTQKSILEPPTLSKEVTEVVEKPKPESSSADTVNAPEAGKDLSSDNIKEWLKEVRPDTSKDSVKDGGPNFKILALLLITLIVLGAAVGGFFYYKKNIADRNKTTKINNANKVAVPSLTQSPSATPTEVDLTALKADILNGSGIKGEAGKAKDLLVKAGFSDKNIDTGNAPSYDFVKTQVQLKKDSPDGIYTAVSDSLKDAYTVVKSDNVLPDSSKYDVVITVGTPN